jgi:hypothetical protein
VSARDVTTSAAEQLLAEHGVDGVYLRESNVIHASQRS